MPASTTLSWIRTLSSSTKQAPHSPSAPLRFDSWLHQRARGKSMVVAAHLKQVDRLMLLLDQEVQLRVRDRPHIIPHGDDALG